MSLDRLVSAFKAHDPDQHTSPLASPKTLAALRRACLKTLGVSLPDGYTRFLAQIDGFIYNGLTIFAARPRVLEGERPVDLGGFVQENEGIRIDRPHFTGFLVFGYNDLDDFVYHISGDKFLVLSRIGEDVFETFTTFDELITHALATAGVK